MNKLTLPVIFPSKTLEPATLNPVAPATPTDNPWTSWWRAIPSGGKRVLGALLVVFAIPLFHWFQLARWSNLDEHELFIPVIFGYMLWVRKNTLPRLTGPASGPALFCGAAGLACFIIGWLIQPSPVKGGIIDQLWPWMIGFVLCLWAWGFQFLGGPFMRAISFPAAFLLFMVPLPIAAREQIQLLLQHASGYVTHAFLSIIGTPFSREGLVFTLPNIQIQVAPECSGIHSSLVLLILGMVAAELFLITGWKKWLLGLAMLPLGIFRNAIRITTIAELCVHIRPEMIDSPIHHQGGPYFFAFSLIPFFILLHYLRRSDRAVSPKA